MLIHKINFKVHGVTFDNENNINIQDGIVKILNDYQKHHFFDELYCGYTKKEIIEMDLTVSEYENCLFTGSIQETVFENKKCYKIYIDTYNNSKFHIGYAPKEVVDELSEWLNKKNLKCIIRIYVTGGKCKHCVTTTKNYEDIENVEIVKLSYGFKVELQFCDDTIANTKITTEEKKLGRFRKFFKNKKG